jgi:hypothetical protein
MVQPFSRGPKGGHRRKSDGSYPPVRRAIKTARSPAAEKVAQRKRLKKLEQFVLPIEAAEEHQDERGDDGEELDGEELDERDGDDHGDGGADERHQSRSPSPPEKKLRSKPPAATNKGPASDTEDDEPLPVAPAEGGSSRSKPPAATNKGPASDTEDDEPLPVAPAEGGSSRSLNMAIARAATPSRSISPELQRRTLRIENYNDKVAYRKLQGWKLNEVAYSL